MLSTVELLVFVVCRTTALAAEAVVEIVEEVRGVEGLAVAAAAA